MNRDLAETTMNVALASSGILDKYLEVLENKLEPDEFREYAHKTGKVMGEILIEILNPIWKEYPELLPEGMGGNYSTNENNIKQTHELLTKLLENSAL